MKRYLYEVDRRVEYRNGKGWEHDQNYGLGSRAEMEQVAKCLTKLGGAKYRASKTSIRR